MHRRERLVQFSARSSRSEWVNNSAWPHTTVRIVRRCWLTLSSSPRVELMIGPVGATHTRCPSYGRGQIAGPPAALRHLHLLQSHARRPASWLVVSDPFRVFEVGPCWPWRVSLANRQGDSERSASFDDDADDARLGTPRRRPAQTGYKTALRGSSSPLAAWEGAERRPRRTCAQQAKACLPCRRPSGKLVMDVPCHAATGARTRRRHSYYLSVA